ncbi:MAG: RNA polymerase sigma factor [Lewinella sp.]|nr:RNA polymerase sigma factor [Lewinella sp.]
MKPTAEQDLDAILAGCRQQHRRSQQALYRLFYAYGMSIAIRYVGNERDAVTVLNDGFLKVFRYIRRFDTTKDFKPWFRQIVVNVAINHIKRQEQYKKEVSMEEGQTISAREEILSRISYQELMALVQSLSVAYRTVFNLYVIDGYRHEEIAGMLGISASTSKSNLARAREKLRVMIQQQMQTKYA